MYALADASNRITIEDRGKTFEGRPILLLTITSEDNHNNINQIIANHKKITEYNEYISIEDQPIVVYQGFSIHGNEASGSNASLLLAYYLAASDSDFVHELLKNSVILLDPSMNPDGLQRFAYWANINKNINLTSDPNDREYNEVWPGGRTNHYWFDLNRDWLPAQLPESQARIKSFNKWIPNILTDHHEMGTNATFFFQPGIPSRTHPLTPKLNQKLTKEIAEHIRLASKKYLENGDSAYLIETLELYVQHVTEHLWKENNRLFMMADARLNYAANEIDKNMDDIEEKKLSELGKTRSHYESLADKLEKKVSEIN